jgi:hypothetical protein
MSVYDDLGRVKVVYEIRTSEGVCYVELDIDMCDLAKKLVLQGETGSGTLLDGTIRFIIRDSEGS